MIENNSFYILLKKKVLFWFGLFTKSSLSLYGKLKPDDYVNR